MDQVLYNLSPFLAALVALVLIGGLYNMLRGGNPNLSQRLMRWRIVLQFIAICVLMGALLLRRS